MHVCVFVTFYENKQINRMLKNNTYNIWEIAYKPQLKHLIHPNITCDTIDTYRMLYEYISSLQFCHCNHKCIQCASHYLNPVAFFYLTSTVQYFICTLMSASGVAGLNLNFRAWLSRKRGSHGHAMPICTHAHPCVVCGIGADGCMVHVLLMLIQSENIMHKS